MGSIVKETARVYFWLGIAAAYGLAILTILVGIILFCIW